MPEATDDLELFTAVPARALVVVAHPDDGDFLAASVLAAWVRQGARATVCLLTDGDAGSDDATIPAGELARVRLAEQRAAAAHLGVDDVLCLGFPDGVLENTLEVRRQLVRVLRQVRPDLVVTMDPTRHWFDRGYLNHPDHRAAGAATLDAVFPSARDGRAFPELLRDEHLEPHRVRYVLLGATDRDDVAVPVQAGDLEAKLRALGEHRSQFDARDMGDWVWKRAREAGARCGVELAEPYRLFDLVPGPSQRADPEPEEMRIIAGEAPPPPEPASDWG
ncbi:MAG TPA: PIG-L deacetylase family protein [Candidatus Micrarchaeia archaeon]|nr:PIG-L deacetylase family protein [Candidatus Micrarchaeia archaeon]